MREMETVYLGVGAADFGSKDTWVVVPAPPMTWPVAFAKSFNLS